MTSNKIDREFWTGRYLRGETGWDLGGPHPLVERILRISQERDLLRSPIGAKALIPGCGRAHDGAFLAQRGMTVVAFDYVNSAVEDARKIYSQVERLHIAEGDALQSPPSTRTISLEHAWQPHSYDIIFDRAMLCALPPADRPKYISMCLSMLRDGGLFITLPFLETVHPKGEGPPFALDLRDFSALTEPYLQLEYFERRTDVPALKKVTVEAIAILRKVKP